MDSAAPAEVMEIDVVGDQSPDTQILLPTSPPPDWCSPGASPANQGFRQRPTTPTPDSVAQWRRLNSHGLWHPTPTPLVF